MKETEIIGYCILTANPVLAAGVWFHCIDPEIINLHVSVLILWTLILTSVIGCPLAVCFLWNRKFSLPALALLLLNSSVLGILVFGAGFLMFGHLD